MRRKDHLDCAVAETLDWIRRSQCHGSFVELQVHDVVKTPSGRPAVRYTCLNCGVTFGLGLVPGEREQWKEE